MIQDGHPGSQTYFFPSWIPDPEFKKAQKAPDPGFGSPTLVETLSLTVNTHKNIFFVMKYNKTCCLPITAY